MYVCCLHKVLRFLKFWPNLIQIDIENTEIWKDKRWVKLARIRNICIERYALYYFLNCPRFGWYPTGLTCSRKYPATHVQSTRLVPDVAPCPLLVTRPTLLCIYCCPLTNQRTIGSTGELPASVSWTTNENLCKSSHLSAFNNIQLCVMLKMCI